MSRLRRIRRQNRMELRTIPGPRVARSTLADFATRRARLFSGLRLRNRREAKRPVIIATRGNELSLDLNRQIEQVRRVRDYDKIRAKQSSRAVKPVSMINVDGSVTVDLPPEHPICVRRRERRMLMFAAGKAGQVGQRRPRNNDLKLRCK